MLRCVADKLMISQGGGQCRRSLLSHAGRLVLANDDGRAQAKTVKQQIDTIQLDCIIT
jgi:hypothetical protein